MRQRSERKLYCWYNKNISLNNRKIKAADKNPSIDADYPAHTSFSLPPCNLGIFFSCSWSPPFLSRSGGREIAFNHETLMASTFRCIISSSQEISCLKWFSTDVTQDAVKICKNKKSINKHRFYQYFFPLLNEWTCRVGSRHLVFSEFVRYMRDSGWIPPMLVIYRQCFQLCNVF